MKVVAFNGSSRRDGNTATLVWRVFQELAKDGIETEMVQLAGQPIHGCIGCGKCGQNKDQRCAVRNDVVNDCLAKMVSADGIILASPVYFADVSPELKALIDRCGMVAKGNDHLLKRKVGAAVVAVRRGGAIHAFDTINHFFTIEQMIIPGASYWNVGIGHESGAVERDEEGMRTMKILGENMAWLLNKLQK
jgi:multimeric flavodoxin WrbA